MSLRPTGDRTLFVLKERHCALWHWILGTLCKRNGVEKLTEGGLIPLSSFFRCLHSLDLVPELTWSVT